MKQEFQVVRKDVYLTGFQNFRERFTKKRGLLLAHLVFDWLLLVYASREPVIGHANLMFY